MHTQFMDAMKAALLRFRQLKQLLAGVMLGLLALSTLQAHADGKLNMYNWSVVSG